MKRVERRILIVGFLCVFFLLMQLVFQLIGVRKTVGLADKQYHQQVALALNEFSTEYTRYVLTQLSATNSCEYSIDSASGVAYKPVFDSLLNSYIEGNKLSPRYAYEWTPAKDSAGQVATFNSAEGQDQVLVKLPIDGRGKAQETSYLLKLTSHQPLKHLVSNMWLWLAFSVASILLVAGSLVYLLSMVFKQKRRTDDQGDFINSMIHELKTPVSTITVCSKVLKNAGTTVTDMEKVRQYALIVEEENQRIWSCIDSLLQTLTVNKNTLNLKKENFSINEVVRLAIESFSVSATAKQVTLDMKLEKSDPLVFADKTHIRSVLDNLIDNAIKYSPVKAEVCVSTERFGNRLLIVVEDKGKGISAKDQKHIFDKFYRAASAKKDNIKGFGLGLHYVKQVVEAHNGKLFIKSLVNKGTRIGIIV